MANDNKSSVSRLGKATSGNNARIPDPANGPRPTASPVEYGFSKLASAIAPIPPPTTSGPSLVPTTSAAGAAATAPSVEHGFSKLASVIVPPLPPATSGPSLVPTKVPTSASSGAPASLSADVQRHQEIVNKAQKDWEDASRQPERLSAANQQLATAQEKFNKVISPYEQQHLLAQEAKAALPPDVRNLKAALDNAKANAAAIDWQRGAEPEDAGRARLRVAAAQERLDQATAPYAQKLKLEEQTRADAAVPPELRALKQELVRTQANMADAAKRGVGRGEALAAQAQMRDAQQKFDKASAKYAQKQRLDEQARLVATLPADVQRLHSDLTFARTNAANVAQQRGASRGELSSAHGEFTAAQEKLNKAIVAQKKDANERFAESQRQRKLANQAKALNDEAATNKENAGGQEYTVPLTAQSSLPQITSPARHEQELQMLETGAPEDMIGLIYSLRDPQAQKIALDKFIQFHQTHPDQVLGEPKALRKALADALAASSEEGVTPEQRDEFYINALKQGGESSVKQWKAENDMRALRENEKKKTQQVEKNRMRYLGGDHSLVKQNEERRKAAIKAVGAKYGFDEAQSQGIYDDVGKIYEWDEPFLGIGDPEGAHLLKDGRVAVNPKYHLDPVRHEVEARAAMPLGASREEIEAAIARRPGIAEERATKLLNIIARSPAFSDRVNNLPGRTDVQKLNQLAAEQRDSVIGAAYHRLIGNGQAHLSNALATAALVTGPNMPVKNLLPLELQGLASKLTGSDSVTDWMRYLEDDANAREALAQTSNLGWAGETFSKAPAMLENFGLAAAAGMGAEALLPSVPGVVPILSRLGVTTETGINEAANLGGQLMYGFEKSMGETYRSENEKAFEAARDRGLFGDAAEVAAWKRAMSPALQDGTTGAFRELGEEVGLGALKTVGKQFLPGIGPKLWYDRLRDGGVITPEAAEYLFQRGIRKSHTPDDDPFSSAGILP